MLSEKRVAVPSMFGIMLSLKQFQNNEVDIDEFIPLYCAGMVRHSY